MSMAGNMTGYRWAKRTKTQQLIAELTAPKKNKFGAVKETVDGITFDSKREAQVWCELKLRMRAGEIEKLDRQIPFFLTVNAIQIARYTADFQYYDKMASAWRVVDVKSPTTAKKRDFVLIRKLMRACHGIEVEVLL